MTAEYTWIKLFSNCVIVKGYSRSAICDLQRGNVFPIPNSLSSLFSTGNTFNILEVKENLNTDEKKIVDEYVSFLLEQEFAFVCAKEELDYFPQLSSEWLFPAHISNAVLDTNSKFDYFDSSFLLQLEKLCCNHLQFRFYNPVSLNYLKILLEIIKPTQIKSIEIVLPENSEENQFYDRIFEIVDEHKKISILTITNAGENKVLKKENFRVGNIVCCTENINNILHCGLISYKLFSINIPTYTESLNYNTCLNRKISIDSNGNIKNCPSMKESFGNIKDTTLQEAIEKPGFKKYWNITKDQITKCKDCEFRYVCTDCRAYLDNPDDIYSAPLKCGYNPYTCEWEEWSTHPMKQKAIEYYKMRDILS